MDIEHKIGQLLIVGLAGTEIDAESRDMLDAVQPGGVLLSTANIESATQVLELTGAIRSGIRVPPLIAVDQEGGRVDRLKPILSPMPAADLLRAANDAAAAARLGEVTAEALRTLGFNVNLAPVLDIGFDLSAENGLRGRYLGSSAAEVVRLSGAYLEGLQRVGIVGVGKHFPGLGGSVIDSHSSLPEVDRPRDQILREDLLPYTELFSKINARLGTILIGHGHYPAFHGPAPLPATLSKNIATGLLREELGFKGLAITDDLEMGAITSLRSIADAAVEAFEAGADMVMLSTPAGAREAWGRMIEAAKEGRLTPQRIKRSIDNVARVKSTLSPPLQFNEVNLSRLRERIGELNVMLQHIR
ncbi:MAG TPA: glycoside hydrolase family 3 N-terminal domain-containing protein [Blastocatellia bacterium]|nr:glycoside hydrolase family 3 N-terminal domain-containing protein [Blastocatellia bacterium]